MYLPVRSLLVVSLKYCSHCCSLEDRLDTASSSTFQNSSNCSWILSIFSFMWQLNVVSVGDSPKLGVSPVTIQPNTESFRRLVLLGKAFAYRATESKNARRLWWYLLVALFHNPDQPKHNPMERLWLRRRMRFFLTSIGNLFKTESIP